MQRRGFWLCALLCWLVNPLQAQQHPDLRPIPFPVLSDLEDSVKEQIKTSQELLQTALENQSIRGPQLGELYGQLGRVFHSYDFIDSAEACYRNARRLRPVDYRWHHYLGLIYHQLGQDAAAELSFEMAIALEPSDTAARILRGNLYLDLNELEPALNDFQTALEQEPESAAARSGLGRVFLRQDQPREALENFKQALELLPAANSLHYLIAQAYRSLGDLESAQHHLQKTGSVGVAVNDPLMDQVEQLVQGEIVHLLRGRQAFSAGDYEAAAALFQKASEAAPQSSRPRVNLAAALTELGRREEARALLEGVLDKDSGNFTALFNLGILTFSLGDAAAAARYLTSYVEAFPDDLAAVGTLGLALSSLNRPTEAISLLRKAHQMAPSDHRYRRALAQNLLANGQLAEALQVLRQASREYPDDLHSSIMLAQLLAASPEAKFRDGQEAYRLAMKAYQIQKLPEFAAVVALALAEMNRCESAARWQETAIAIVENSGGTRTEDMARTLQFYRRERPCRPGLSPSPEH